MSNPLEATSVATRMSVFFALNSAKVSILWCCVLFPCMNPTFNPISVFSLAASSSVACFVPTNTNTCPACRKERILSANHRYLSDGLITSTTCLISALAAPMVPTVTLVGLTRISRAKCSTLGGNVAEKRTVCLSGRICPEIDRTCGSNPIRNILSASSMTKYVMRWRLVALSFITSIRRPGVPTTISHPFCNARTCSCLFIPPKQGTAVKFIPL
mmetsp:Transcript_13070/g.20960  ORF Transcript_13070/g.20960 Transcript_13070/m.20960 type:complete len:215 (+) Transcript_13070:1086-1730(+)